MLNDCVRDGNRWNHSAIATGFCVKVLRCTLKTIQKTIEHFRLRRKFTRVFAASSCLEEVSSGQRQPITCAPSGLGSWDVFARGAFADSFHESDAPASQALGILVRVGCTPCGASTPRLSTSSSLRCLTGLLREKLHLRAGFTLRCFQRLSFPDAATQLHGWRHDWYTVGPSTPVLSY